MGNDDENRPLYHYSVLQGWMNDPNGLVFAHGEYHLFYQYHPYSLVWGPMHWGHAVSRDLLRWQTLPIALAPDAEGQIFSGSVVVDESNTAGFGAGALVAIYTQHREGRQAQSVAFSSDAGRSWRSAAGNPQLLPPEDIVDFRDPKVLRWTDGNGVAHWVMVLAVGRQIWFYRSADLCRWHKTGEFGGHGAQGGVWECPDLMQMPIDGGPAQRWILMVSVAEGAPAGGSGQQYFVGTFDGERFIADDAPSVVRWADYGADFYAGQSWYAAPHGRRLWLAWLNNWAYARETPATTWRGMMTLPREIGLTDDGGTLRLVQQPVTELTALRQPMAVPSTVQVAAGDSSILATVSAAWELVCTLVVEERETCGGFDIDWGGAQPLRIRYDAALDELRVDRSGCGSVFAHEPVQRCCVTLRDGCLTLRLLVDRQSIELFVDGGRTVLTNQIFPPAVPATIRLIAGRGDLVARDLALWQLVRD